MKKKALTKYFQKRCPNQECFQKLQLWPNQIHFEGCVDDVKEEERTGTNTWVAYQEVTSKRPNPISFTFPPSWKISLNYPENHFTWGGNKFPQGHSKANKLNFPNSASKYVLQHMYSLHPPMQIPFNMLHLFKQLHKTRFIRKIIWIIHDRIKSFLHIYVCRALLGDLHVTFSIRPATSSSSTSSIMPIVITTCTK